MEQNNLVLTKKAIKNHCKRLQLELKNLNQDLSLGETQALFSKVLGLKNFHELKKILENQEDYHFKKIINTFENKNNHASMYVVFIKTVNNIDWQIQKSLKDCLIKKVRFLSESGNKIMISKLDVDSQTCTVHLDHNSEFSDLGNKPGITVHGALMILARAGSDYP